MHLEIEGLELFLSNDPKARMGGAAPVPPSAVPGPGGGAPALLPPASAQIGATSAPAAAVPADVPANWVAVNAPNLGTFYRAPKPGAEPFTEVGQAVTADTEICLIEVMKLFTALQAGVAGTVRRICVPDGSMVEYGQTLFYIEPA